MARRAGAPSVVDGRKARLFLALWPDAATRARLAAERDRWTWSASARPVPDARLHLTLHFIGAVARARLDAIAAGLDVPCAAVTLAFGRPALWRNGIAAFEPSASCAGLAALHASLADALRTLGLRVETRPHRPHVTMARDARGSRPPGDAALRWRASGYALVESQADGAYAVVASYPTRPGRVRSSRAGSGGDTAAGRRRP